MIKKLFLLLGILFVAASNIQSQVVVQLKQPPPGKLNVENLWSVTLKNTTQITYKVYLEGNLTEATDGIIFNATSAEFNLAPGTTTVTVNDVSPISANFPVAKYKNVLMQTGDVPSGQYQVCVQVRQKTGADLGFQCINHTVTQIPAITLLSPAKDADIVEKNPTFNWIPVVFNTPGYKYNLVIAEKIGTPQQSIKVPYFTTSQSQTVLVYPVSAPLLEAGKIYYWQVTLQDPAGNTVQSATSEIFSFKKSDSGPSIVDGFIQLISPVNNGELNTSTGPSGGSLFRFKWKKANTNKSISKYIIKIGKGSNESVALSTGMVNQGEVSANSNATEFQYDIYVEKGLLNKGSEYYWKVETYSISYSSPVGKSDVAKFKVIGGIELAGDIKEFMIGKYNVTVSNITNSTPTNFEGKGKVELWTGGPKIDVEFSKLSLEKKNNVWTTNAGKIQCAITPQPQIKLEHSETKSTFEAQTIILTPNEARIYGSVVSVFPLTTKGMVSSGIGNIQTEGMVSVKIKSFPIWYNISPTAKISGGDAYCDKEYSYELLNPNGFNLVLSKSTAFKLTSNKLELKLSGVVDLPEKIKETDGSKVKIIFKDQKSLKYSVEINQSHTITLPLNKKGDVSLFLKNITIDLVPTPTWKGGVKVNTASISFPVNSGFQGIELNKQNTTGDILLNSKGLTAKSEITGMSYNSNFYGFKAKVDKFVLDYKDNVLNKCSFSGGLYVPVIGVNVNYVIPVTDNGIGKGNLDYSNLGSVYLFGGQPNEEDRLNFKMNSATIKNDKIIFQGELELDNKKGENLKTGKINVNNLFVTSSGEIGFDGSSWKQLNNYTDADYNGYDVTLTRVRFRQISTGNYSFDVDGTVIVSEDLSAPGGSILGLSYKFYKNANQGGSGSELTYSNQIEQNKIQVEFMNGESKFVAGLEYWKDDPKFGKGFMATFSMDMKSPSAYSFSSKIVTGIAPAGFKYWFAEAYTDFPTPVAIGIGDLGLYGFKGRIYSKMSHSGTGIGPSDYHPDINNTFGVFAEVPFLSTSDNGYKIWGKTAFEIMIGNGFKSVLTGDAYILSSGYGSTDGKVYGNVTVTVSTNPKYFSCDAYVNANIDGAICGNGTMALYFGEDTWYVNVGTKQSPVTMNMYCGTTAATSYFGLNPNNISFGLGYSIDTGPKKWAVFYGRAWGSLNIDGALNYSPFQFGGTAVLKGGGELGFYYDIFCCEGYLRVLSAEVTAALNVQLPNPVCFAGKISAKGCIWKLCKTVTLKMKYKNGSFSMEENC